MVITMDLDLFGFAFPSGIRKRWNPEYLVLGKAQSSEWKTLFSIKWHRKVSPYTDD